MSMNIEKKTYKLKLIEDLLGTVPKNQEVYEQFIASKVKEKEKKAGDPEAGETKAAEEVETVEDLEEKGWTGFHSDGNGLFLYNYMIKGFLKASCEVMQANGVFPKISAYKKWMDNLVFVEPRKVPLNTMECEGILERPLRVLTPQGPRVTVVRSDIIKSGKEIEFTIALLTNTKGITWDIIDKCFPFGSYVGLGQWRSGGYGQFIVDSVAVIA